MHYNAKRGIEIACRLPIRPSVFNGCGSRQHKLESLKTNCTVNRPNTFALRSPKAVHLIPEEHGEIWGE